MGFLGDCLGFVWEMACDCNGGYCGQLCCSFLMGFVVGC